MRKFKDFITEAGRCWKGYKPVPGKKAYTPGSCVKEDTLEEATAEKAMKQHYKWVKSMEGHTSESIGKKLEDAKDKHDKHANEVQERLKSGSMKHGGYEHKEMVKKWNRLQRNVSDLQSKHDWLKSKENKANKVSEEIELDETEAWQRKEGQSESGGLNRKGIASYRAANPGSKLSMAVTTKPSKLKAGSKAANRRKSFCARMGGMKRRLTSAKTARDPDSRINKALRKWNC